MTIRYPLSPILVKGAAVALAVVVLFQALPLSLQSPLPPAGDDRGGKSSLTAVNICGDEGGGVVSPTGSFLCPPPPFPPPPPAFSSAGLCPDGEPLLSLPARRIFRPPRPAAFS